jgi:hypothetical protein
MVEMKFEVNWSDRRKIEIKLKLAIAVKQAVALKLDTSSRARKAFHWRMQSWILGINIWISVHSSHFSVFLLWVDVAVAVVRRILRMNDSSECKIWGTNSRKIFASRSINHLMTHELIMSAVNNQFNALEDKQYQNNGSGENQILCSIWRFQQFCNHFNKHVHVKWQGFPFPESFTRSRGSHKNLFFLEITK